MGGEDGAEGERVAVIIKLSVMGARGTLITSDRDAVVRREVGGGSARVERD
jgi:hypothetical protein